MTLSTATLHQAESRLARHYAQRLRQASRSLRYGPANHRYWVDHIRADWEQIAEQRALTARRQGADRERAQVCVEFAATTSDVLRIVLTPAEHMVWSQDALEAARAIDDVEMERELLYKAGFLGLTLETPDAAEAYGRQLLALVEADRSPRDRGRAHFLIGAAAFLRGEYPRAEEGFFASIACLEKITPDEALGQNWLGLGRVASLHGDYPRAQQYYTRYLEFTIAQGNQQTELEARVSMSGVHLAQGDLALAEEYALRALEAARAYGVTRYLPVTLFSLAHAQKAQGKLEQAVAHYMEGIQTARLISAPSTVANGLHGLGQTRAMQGDLDEAVRWCEEALERARQGRILIRVGEAASDLVLLYVRQGRLDAAQARLIEAVRTAVKLDTPYFVAKALAGAVVLWAAQGDLERATLWTGLLLDHPGQLRPSLYAYTSPGFERLEQTLGPARYREAVERGRRLSFAEALAELSRVFAAS